MLPRLCLVLDRRGGGLGGSVGWEQVQPWRPGQVWPVDEAAASLTAVYAAATNVSSPLCSHTRWFA